MDNSVLNKIANILLTDRELILNWRMLFDGLNLPADDCVQLERQVNNGNIESYVLFSRILSKWSSVNGNKATLDVLRQVLETNGFRLVADKLDNIQALARSQENPPILFEVGTATKNFVGRENELQELEELYQSQADVLVTTVGMGGVGKSELVKTFAKKITETESASCIWLNGETRESLKSSVTRLADLVKPSRLNINQQIDVLFCLVISSIKIQINARILVVVDNVDGAYEDVRKLISKISKGDCFFLVTSRDVGVLQHSGRFIQLDILSEEAAVSLLKKSEIDEPVEEMKKLCALLGNFPLALHQAAAYIKKQKLTSSKGKSYKISNYMEVYESQKSILLGHELSLIDHDYRETTLITWKMSFEKIQKDEKFGHHAIELLNTIAYFKPDDIHLNFLIFCKNDLNDTIPLIKNYSLINGEDDVISIHRLIQQVIQLNLRADQLEIPHLTKIITDIQILLKSAENHVGLNGRLRSDDYVTEPTLLDIKKGMLHITSVWEHVAKYPELLNDFKHVFLDTVNSLNYFKLFQHIIDLCFAIQSKLNNNNKLNNILSTNDELTLRIESELFHAQYKLNKHQDDKSLFGLQSVYNKQKDISREDNSTTLITAHYIVMINIRNLNKVNAEVKSELLEHCKTVVKSKSEVFGSLHKSTLSTKLLLAESSEYNQDAANLYEECFQWQLTNLGADRVSTHNILTSYIRCLTAIGEYEKAKCVLEHYLQQTLRQTFADWGNQELSFVTFNLGQTEKAFSALRRAIIIRNEDDKISQFDSTLLKYNEAENLLKSEKYSEALAMYRKLEIRQFSRDWWSIDAEHKISQCLFGLKRFMEARDILQNICRLQRNFGGANCNPILMINKLLEDTNHRITADQVETNKTVEFEDPP